MKSEHLPKNGDEVDAFSRFRKVHPALRRAGAVKAIKRRSHRIDRAAAKRTLCWEW